MRFGCDDQANPESSRMTLPAVKLKTDGCLNRRSWGKPFSTIPALRGVAIKRILESWPDVNALSALALKPSTHPWGVAPGSQLNDTAFWR